MAFLRFLPPLGDGQKTLPCGSIVFLVATLACGARRPDESDHSSVKDASAWITTKDAAKCAIHCERQNSVNQKEAERNLRSKFEFL